MTPRQAEVFAFIRERIESVGCAPTLEVIGDRFGFSKPRACIIVTELVEQGALCRKHPGTHGLRLPGHTDLTVVGTGALRAELARRGVTFEAMDQPRPFLDGGRACAANHCMMRVPRGHLMCREHWFKLPPLYRSAIMNAWSSRQVTAYQEAVEEARNYLGGYVQVAERVG